jgi:GH24 family phage-related lysozyme (muramidase)
MIGPIAQNVKPPAFRHVIPEALTLIKGTEGLSLKPYQGKKDKRGVLTVGWGHKIVLGEEHLYDHGITVKQAEDLLSRDVARHCAFLQQDIGGPVVILDNWEFGAFASFCYNLGPRILLTAHHVTEAVKHVGVKAGVMEIYRFSNDGNGEYADGLFYRRLQETMLGVGKRLASRPGSCVEAYGLIEQIQKIGDAHDILNYFNNHHIKALCNVCKYKMVRNDYRLPAVTKPSGKQSSKAK